MTPDLAIIIVNWNGGEFLRKCLDSLVQFPPTISHEVIVIDNASTDGSAQATRSYPGVRLILNTENVGFGRANNQAFAATAAPLLFLLNSDAEVHEGTLDTLVATINESEKIGAVGPRLLNTDGTLQPSVWRNPPSPGEIGFCLSASARVCWGSTGTTRIASAPICSVPRPCCSNER